MAKNEVIGDFKIKEKSEDNLMAQCHQWLWNTYPEHRYKFWHVANERKISLMEGAKLKAKGVLAGVPDYVVNFRGQAFYIEFKKNRGVYSTAQTTVIAALRREHIGVV